MDANQAYRDTVIGHYLLYPIPTRTAIHLGWRVLWRLIPGFNDFLTLKSIEEAPEYFESEDYRKVLDMGVKEMAQALGDFQRVAMTGAKYENCKQIFLLQCAREAKFTTEQEAALELIYRISQDEVLGLLLEEILKTSRDTRDNKTRVQAALAAKELMSGGNPGSENLKQLIVKLAS